jgi:cytochrome P450
MPVPPPADPVAAVTHPHPYPYYADLAARAPFHRDPALGLWVACGGAAIGAVLRSPACRVRPPSEPVPRALAGTPAAEVFGQLIRMNDGAHHGRWRPPVTAALDALAPADVLDEARRGASELPAHPAAITHGLPARVLARLLGVPSAGLDQVVAWTGQLVRCFAPGASPVALAEGQAAAVALRDRIGEAIGRGTGGLLAGVARDHEADRESRETVVANAVGLLTQSWDATAGLIGNTLVALGRGDDAEDLPRVVEEVLRRDPPVQNTRRFVAEEVLLGGHRLQEGDAILVVLAAASRDRGAAEAPTFGQGPHACPGARLARLIAQAGVERVLSGGADLVRLAGTVTYHPLVNARVPAFPPA